MKVEELIEKYYITQAGHYSQQEGRYVYDDLLVVGSSGSAKRDGAIEEIKAKEQEILAYLVGERQEKKEAEEERKRKIARIEGLKEIEDARADLAKWEREFEKSFDDCGGLGVRPYPQYDLEAMYKKYPAAKAYLVAKEEAYSANYESAKIGKKAMNQIIENPDDYERIMAEMEQDIDEFVKRHIWD